MRAEIALVKAPARMWRVERAEASLRFSRISPVDAMADRAGNRFDVPGAGVLYGATDAMGAFAETLARFRPSASIAGRLAEREDDPGFPRPGQVPSAWRRVRRLRSFEVVNAFPFVDIEAPATHTYLTQNAPQLLVERGLENLDVATVRGSSRLLTRALAIWLFSRTDEHGAPLFAGIRYISRLGDYECWAIFDGTTTLLLSDDPIELTHPSLQSIAETFGIHVD